MADESFRKSARIFLFRICCLIFSVAMIIFGGIHLAGYQSHIKEGKRFPKFSYPHLLYVHNEVLRAIAPEKSDISFGYGILQENVIGMTLTVVSDASENDLKARALSQLTSHGYRAMDSNGYRYIKGDRFIWCSVEESNAKPGAHVLYLEETSAFADD